VSGTWQLLDDSGHEPYNLDDVSTVGNYIQVDYEDPMDRVSSVQVTADNDYNISGITAGVSASLGYLRINLRQNGSIITPSQGCGNNYTNIWITAWEAE
jgi:hypothetical protein